MCGQIDIPVSKSTGSHHLKVLREAGVVKAREEGTKKYHSLRRTDLDARFPGLLHSVLRSAPVSGCAARARDIVHHGEPLDG